MSCVICTILVSVSVNFQRTRTDANTSCNAALVQHPCTVQSSLCAVSVTFIRLGGKTISLTRSHVHRYAFSAAEICAPLCTWHTINWLLIPCPVFVWFLFSQLVPTVVSGNSSTGRAFPCTRLPSISSPPCYLTMPNWRTKLHWGPCGEWISFQV